MMKRYDYKKAAKIIDAAILTGNLISADMGMHEDWFWTADCVWEGGAFTKTLADEPEIAGIRASRWATPSLLLQYADGTEKVFSCFAGESTGTMPDSLYGCLSSKAQAVLPDIEEYDE